MNKHKKIFVPRNIGQLKKPKNSSGENKDIRLFQFPNLYMSLRIFYFVPFAAFEVVRQPQKSKVGILKMNSS